MHCQAPRVHTFPEGVDCTLLISHSSEDISYLPWSCLKVYPGRAAPAVPRSGDPPSTPKAWSLGDSSRPRKEGGRQRICSPGPAVHETGYSSKPTFSILKPKMNANSFASKNLGSRD